MKRLICRVFGHRYHAHTTVAAHVNAHGRTATVYGVLVACLWCGKRPR